MYAQLTLHTIFFACFFFKSSEASAKDFATQGFLSANRVWCCLGNYLGKVFKKKETENEEEKKFYKCGKFRSGFFPDLLTLFWGIFFKDSLSPKKEAHLIEKFLALEVGCWISKSPTLVLYDTAQTEQIAYIFSFVFEYSE